MKIFIVTDRGTVIPCTLNKNVLRPTVKGGYRILRKIKEKGEIKC